MKKVKYSLLEYQVKATNKINEKYKSHSVTGAVMPTGVGKSFIAMAEMIAINNQEYKGIDEEFCIKVPVMENGVVNNAKILYVAPTNEIAEQIKIDIVEYICKVNPDNVTLEQRDILVKQVFPNLKFVCYKTLASGVDNHNKGKRTEIDPFLEAPDFVILDEVHRSGAPKFQEGVAALLGCKVENGEVIKDENALESKKNIKVLTLSATPERDLDSRDMTKVWAKSLGSYTEEELEDARREDLAMRMTLPDAIKKGILRNQNVVHFDCNLGETDEYKSLIRVCKDEKLDIRIRKEAEEAIKEINHTVLKIEDYHKMSDNQKKEAREEREIETLIDAINNGLLNIHGKFIFFAPKNTKKNNPNNVSPFLEYYSERTVREFKQALNRCGKENEIIVEYISSEQDNEKNKKVLSDFDKKDVTKGPMYIVVAQDKFNEGVHAKKISGGINRRKITEQENTTLRAQSILFLQQDGRSYYAIIPGKELPQTPTIFDMCNNFYTQNINGAIDPEQKIQIFELTETQKILHDAYVRIMDKVPEKANINIKLPKLLQVANLLNKYNIKVNSENISDRTTLLKLLQREEYKDKRSQIMEEFEKIGIIHKKDDKNEYSDYKIGVVLKESREAFWKGTKVFRDYPMKELISSGIIDKDSQEYKKYAIQKGYVKDGFIIMGVTKEFINKNINTGDYVNEEGKDVEGFKIDQFNPETGRDENQYDRRGFDEKGIHKDTNTIHNKSGFMANGINILTGTKYDLAGYDIDGIKPFYNVRAELVGGFDREHYFHSYDDCSETFCKIKSGKLAPYDKGIKVDEFGFISGRKKNVYTNSDLTPFPNEGFFNNGYNYYTKEKYNKYGYDIEGYDENRFNLNKINRETGTRFDVKGKKASYYDTKSNKIREKMKNIKLGNIKIEKDRFIKIDNGQKYSNLKGFRTDGVNVVTEEYEDIYGFNFFNYLEEKQTKNQYGFYPKEVKNIEMGAELRPGFENSVYKYYGKNNVPVNIFGTDKTGHIVDNEGNLKKEMHPSIIITGNYIKNCIEKGMTTKKFCEEYALENKMLYDEAKSKIFTSINQAFNLYRICPELSKNAEIQDSIKILVNSEKIRSEKFFTKIFGIKSAMTKDARKLETILEQLNKKIELEGNQIKIDALIKRRDALKRRYNEMKSLQVRIWRVDKMNNNINEVNNLVKKNMISKIKAKIFEIFIRKNDKKKYSVDNNNYKIFTLNFPQYANFNDNELQKLIKEREEEIKARKQLELINNMKYQEILRENQIDVTDEMLKENENSEELENELEKYKNNHKIVDEMIYDKESCKEVINKLKEKQIKYEDLSILDLVKINLMLQTEIDIKLKKYDNESREKILEEIQNLEDKINRALDKKNNN